MSSEKIRKLFLDFFERRGHTVVPSSSLIPDDPSVLLTTAGMQQFKRYFTGELDPVKDFGSKNTVSIQKSFRTSDIDEVGDESHLTFFEMLGNFSFGGYFKKEAIEYAHEFITEVMNLKIDYVSVFKGKGDIPRDVESASIWKSIDPDIVVKEFVEDNLWGPTGNEGPFGPTTEVYVNGVEVWNVVFNQYYRRKAPDLKPGGRTIPSELFFEELKIKGIDTGMGLERLAMVSQNVPTIFDTDLFKPLMRFLPEDSDERTKRILADHSRGIAFLISDGVRPSNKEAGYILRRLIRRLITHFYLAGNKIDPQHVFEEIFENYGGFYPDLNGEIILEEFIAERERFLKTLQAGLKELEKIKTLDAKSAFGIFSSYGLPYEIIKELGKDKAKKLSRESFDREFEKHQEVSRAGQEKKFGGHGLLLDTGELKAGDKEELEKVTRLHTATHLLNQALREVLGEEVEQRGSDITTLRTRFDFTFPRKMTPEEIEKVEKLVNEKVKEDLPVSFKEMPKLEAEKTGALRFFKGKYPDVVKVYYIGKSLTGAWSKEFCGGPHVEHTGVIGKFKIIKEEASSAGIRRIRATVE